MFQPTKHLTCDVIYARVKAWKIQKKKTTLNVDDPPAARIAEAIGEDNVAAKPPEHLFKMLQFHIAEKKNKKKKRMELISAFKSLLWKCIKSTEISHTVWTTHDRHRKLLSKEA